MRSHAPAGVRKHTIMRTTTQSSFELAAVVAGVGGLVTRRAAAVVPLHPVQ
jgi:hypothetical protein